MRKLLYILIVPALIFGSCSDWLDVPPPTSVSEDELFTTQEGFQEGVNGIYASAAHYDLYGGVFTVEMLDAMMQNYAITAADLIQYQKTASFDYADGMTRTRFNMIWNKGYNTITNCNLVLNSIEEQRQSDLFDDGIGEIVEAEALAMRAYVHFDMLRLCVPVGADAEINSGSLAIPYVTTYSKDVTPLSTGAQAIEKIVADLDKAKELLAEHDPILDKAYEVGYPVYNAGSGNTPEENITLTGSTERLPLFLRNRRHHMNYYAVCGTLARVHLWNATAYGKTESFALAATNANEVIRADKFPWVEQGAITGSHETNTYDRVFYTELVFALYTDNADEIDQLRSRFANPATGYCITQPALNELYEYNNLDYRYDSWFALEPGSTLEGAQVMKVLKYLRNNKDEIGNLHYLVSPAIRLTEMYYILAECQNSGASIGVNAGDPWATLGEVRLHRGLDEYVNVHLLTFKDELLKEYHKEFYAEGQAFLNYKRLQGTIMRFSPLLYYYPSNTGTGTGNPNGIYSPKISDHASYGWLPTDETNNRI